MDWIALLQAFKSKYQPALTRRLDELEDVSFDQHLLDEIVLWKLNRYVEFPPAVIESINRLSNLADHEFETVRPLLLELLAVHGVDLPMASTILRFKRPDVFPIVDRRAYRVVMQKDLKIHASTNPNLKVDLYFNYIVCVREWAAARDIPFKEADRVLYQEDKASGRRLI